MLLASAEAWRQKLVNLTLVLSDVVLILLVWGLACLAEMFWAPGYPSIVVHLSSVPVALVWVGTKTTLGLYPGCGLNQAEELRRQTYALFATFALVATLALGFQIAYILSRFVLAMVFVSLLLLSPCIRQLVKGWLMRKGVWGKPVIILGTRDAGTRMEELLRQEWRVGFRPVATLFNGRSEAGLAEAKEGRAGKPDEDVLAEAVELSCKHRVNTLLLVMPHASREYMTRLVNLASVHFRSVVLIPDLAEISGSTMIAWNFAGTLGVEIRHSLLDPTVQRAKRTLDLLLAVVGGLLILPLFLLIVGLILVESHRSPVFYKASRMGLNGTLFSCLKFRTMVPDADDALQKILAEDPNAREEYWMYHKLRYDPRVTKVGRFLRKTSLDEIPQLWNVLRGEMSIVGPRPYLPRESVKIGVMQGEIMRVYPGITGPWQVSGRNQASFVERVEVDAYYVRNWSIWLDLLILARTVWIILSGRGAH